MYAALINGIAVAVAALCGILFKNKINEKYTSAILLGLAIVVGIIGASYAIGTEDTLGMILCIVAGILFGEWINIEKHLNRLGDMLKNKFSAESGNDNTFTEGFVASSLLFCIGPMAIIGSLQAGTVGDATIIFSKTVIDCITALSFAVALGAGVIFSGVSVLLYQGLLTLLAVWVSPYLGNAVINEMSAIGGVLMIAISLNMLGIKKIRVGNMLPAVFLPILYQPFAHWLTNLF
ncbi:putative membrane protein YdfK [anaerobic digester metagenome]